MKNSLAVNGYGMTFITYQRLLENQSNLALTHV
jgi:hypothetical protein